MKTISLYLTKPSQPKGNSQRAYLIFKLERDWPAMRLGLRNGRSLSRLSTKQLEAKYRQYERIERKQRDSYVSWLNAAGAAA